MLHTWFYGAFIEQQGKSLQRDPPLKDLFTPELKFPENVLTPMPYEMWTSFFIQSKRNEWFLRKTFSI